MFKQQKNLWAKAAVRSKALVLLLLIYCLFLLPLLVGALCLVLVLLIQYSLFCFDYATHLGFLINFIYLFIYTIFQEGDTFGM